MIDLDTRYKAVVHYKHFIPSLRKVSAIYNVSKSSLHRWICKVPSARKSRTTKQLSTSIASTIRECLTNNPFITSRGVAEVVCSSCGIKRSRSCLSSYIKQCRFSRKKAYRMVDHQHSAEGILRFGGPKYRGWDGRFSVVMFGDWNGGHGSPGSRKACGPLQEIKYRLRSSPHVDLRSVDEFRSSVTCSKCCTRLTNMRASTTQWNRTSKKKMETRVRESTRCCTVPAV